MSESKKPRSAKQKANHPQALSERSRIRINGLANALAAPEPPAKLYFARSGGSKPTGQEKTMMLMARIRDVKRQMRDEARMRRQFAPLSRM